MKKVHLLLSFIALACAALVLGACSSDSDTPEAASVSVASVTPSATIPCEGGDVTAVVKATGKPTLYQYENWITNDAPTLSGGSYTYVFHVAKNDGDARKARISFALGDKSETIEIAQAAAPAPEIPDTPVSKVHPLGLGWNLGNQLDAHINGVAAETAWGNKATTQALFDKLAADGLRTVRIPVTWLGHVGDAPSYTIDDKWLDRVAEVVGYAERAGLKAIINIHHDGANTGNWLDVAKAATDADFKAGMTARFAAIWSQIATRFADKGDFLIFEPFNELHDGSWGWGANRNDGGKQYAVVNELNQLFVNTVRATGGKNTDRWLAAVGYCTNPDLTMQHLVLPTDPTKDRLMVAVHYYDPNTFTLEAKFTDWGHTGKAGKKESWGNEADVEKLFAKLKTKYVDQGIPVYIGEGGCVHMATDRAEAFRKYYLEYVAKCARDNELAYIIWDNGSTGAGNECHGYYDHATGAYINNAADIIAVLVRGYYTDDPAYTLKSVYDSAPTF